MELLFLTFLAKPLWMWLLFITLVVALLAFDLGVLHKDNHEIGIRESLRQLRGHIDIDSSPGLGTRITITLPLRRWRP